MLTELGSPGEDGSGSVHDHAVAVEDQVVLAADEIDVGDDGVGLDRPARDEREPHLVLVALVGRGIDDHQQAGIRLEHPGQRSAVAPEVLADDDRDVGTVQVEHQQFVPGDEDPVLVEDRVVRKVVFGVARDHLAAMQHARTVLRDRGRRIAGPEIAGLERPVRMAQDHRQLTQALVTKSSRHRSHPGSRGGEEARAGGEILDRVPGQRHLADGQQVRAAGDRSPRGRYHLFRVSGDVADDGVGLAERQAETGHSK